MPDALFSQVAYLMAFAPPLTDEQRAVRQQLLAALQREDPGALVEALRAVGRTWDVSTWASRRAFALAKDVERWAAERSIEEAA